MPLTTLYTTRPGDSAQTLAKTYNTTPEAIISANPTGSFEGGGQTFWGPNMKLNIPGVAPINNVVSTAGPATSEFNTHSSNLNTMLTSLNQTPAKVPGSDLNVGNVNDPYTRMLDRMSASSDAATKALISTIQAQRAQHGATLDNQYENYKRGLALLGIQHNAAQATPDLLMGHIQQAETEHQQKLGQLDVEMNKAIMDANTAKDKNDLATLRDKMDYIDKLKKEKQDYLKNIADQMTASNTIADNVVAGVYDNLQKLSPADKESYLVAVSQKYGISLGSLTAALTKQKQAAEDRALSIANTKSIMANRGGAGGSEKILTPAVIKSLTSQNPLLDLPYGTTQAEALAAQQAATDWQKAVETDYTDPENLGPQGYLTYDYGKKLFSNFPSGVSKTQFVINNRDLFNHDKHLKEYGLTDAEIKIITGQ